MSAVVTVDREALATMVVLSTEKVALSTVVNAGPTRFLADWWTAVQAEEPGPLTLAGHLDRLRLYQEEVATRWSL